MKFRLRNLTSRRGIAQIPLIVGLLLMAIAIPVATRLSQESQNIENRASGCTGGNGYEKCEANLYYVCIAGQWDYKQTCGSGCDGTKCRAGCDYSFTNCGACGAGCAANEKRCYVTNNNCTKEWKCLNLGNCVANPTTPPSQNCGDHPNHSNWCEGSRRANCANGTVYYETCQYGCNSGSGNCNGAPASQPTAVPKCTPNSLQCITEDETGKKYPNGVQRKCNGVGSGWDVVHNCTNGCSGNLCKAYVTNTPNPTPTPNKICPTLGNKKCENNKIYTCTLIAQRWDWVLSQDCGSSKECKLSTSTIATCEVKTLEDFCGTPNVCRDSGGGRANCASYNMTTVYGKVCPTGQICCVPKDAGVATPAPIKKPSVFKSLLQKINFVKPVYAADVGLSHICGTKTLNSAGNCNWQSISDAKWYSWTCADFDTNCGTSSGQTLPIINDPCMDKWDHINCTADIKCKWDNDLYYCISKTNLPCTNNGVKYLPGQRKCELGGEKNFQVCKLDGTWSVAFACPVGQVCSGEGMCIDGQAGLRGSPCLAIGGLGGVCMAKGDCSKKGPGYLVDANSNMVCQSGLECCYYKSNDGSCMTSLGRVVPDKKYDCWDSRRYMVCNSGVMSILSNCPNGQLCTADGCKKEESAIPVCVSEYNGKCIPLNGLPPSGYIIHAGLYPNHLGCGYLSQCAIPREINCANDEICSSGIGGVIGDMLQTGYTRTDKVCTYKTLLGTVNEGRCYKLRSDFRTCKGENTQCFGGLTIDGRDWVRTSEECDTLSEWLGTKISGYCYRKIDKRSICEDELGGTCVFGGSNPLLSCPVGEEPVDGMIDGILDHKGCGYWNMCCVPKAKTTPKLTSTPPPTSTCIGNGGQCFPDYQLCSAYGTQPSSGSCSSGSRCCKALATSTPKPNCAGLYTQPTCITGLNGVCEWIDGKCRNKVTPTPTTKIDPKATPIPSKGPLLTAGPVPTVGPVPTSPGAPPSAPTNPPSPPSSSCSYDSLQARVQPNTTIDWNTQLTLAGGEKVNLGCMHDGSGQLASNVKIVVEHSSGAQNEFSQNLVDQWTPPRPGNYTVWCKSMDTNCTGLVSSTNATLSVGSACRECPNDFHCYGPADDKVEYGYRWFATGYVQSGWTTQVPDNFCTDYAGLPKPLWLGKAMGDANCDGKLDLGDVAVWRGEYADISMGERVVRDNWEADFTGVEGKCDGVVDIGDYSLWRANFTKYYANN